MKIKKIIKKINGYMYDDLIKQEILAVHDKLDGSMITFVKLPNGNVVAKTKMSFISDQAMLAYEIYNTRDNMKNMINELIDTGYTPIFEVTSHRNQIVLEYHLTELWLLQIRDIDGQYMRDINTVADAYHISSATSFPKSTHTLDNLLTRKKLEEGIEGWVVTTKNGHYKIKTDWYFQLHGLVTEGTRENLLIKTILDENIDDVISQLMPGEKRDFIEDITDKVNHKFNHLVVEFKELRRKYFQDFKSNRKEFAIAYSKDELFSSIMRTLNTSFREVEQVAEKSVKEHILNKTKQLGAARIWIESELK